MPPYGTLVFALLVCLLLSAEPVLFPVCRVIFPELLVLAAERADRLAFGHHPHGNGTLNPVRRAKG
jgi:hypothetical protein